MIFLDIQLLNYIAIFLTLSPPRSLKYAVFFKIYSIVILVTLLGSGFYLINSYKEANSKNLWNIGTVIEILHGSSMVIAIGLAIIRTSFYNFKKFGQLLHKLAAVEIILDRPSTKGRNGCFRMKFILIHIVIIGVYVNDARAWLTILSRERFIFEQTLLYFNIIITFLITTHGLCIKFLLENLNDSLHKTDVRSSDLISNIKKLMAYQQVYCTLRRAVDIFNSIFGWQMFWLYENIFMGFLCVVNFLVQFVTPTSDHQFNGQVKISLFTWFSFLMIMGVVVAITCDMTTKEAKKTATICYNLLLDTPAVSNNVQDHILREELILLAQQATHQCPYFSAAGFFNVNYTTLLGLLATVTSYIIVIIQLNKYK